MVDFPRRMRDWLFNIMRDLADRDELSTHYLNMEREAESNMTRRWTNAAIWKFCELDGNPPDRSVFHFSSQFLILSVGQNFNFSKFEIFQTQISVALYWKRSNFTVVKSSRLASIVWLLTFRQSRSTNVHQMTLVNTSK